MVEIKKSIKHIMTYEQGKSYSHFEKYKTFDVVGFFKDKKLSLLEVLSIKPLKLLVQIEEDETDYPVYPDGNVANNTGRVFRLYLDVPKNVGSLAGQILSSGSAYVEFDYEDCYVKMVSYEKLFVYTGGIVLIDKEQPNLKEFYSART
jgi:hypothetical protein